MHVGIHQIPKSILRYLLLSLQHVLAMFGANILIPIIFNTNVGEVVIPVQIAFFCSGIGTIIYLLITGFKVPIYLGSSAAFVSGMTAYYLTTGYSVFISLIVVGFVYVIIAAIIWFTKGATKITKFLPPIIIGPAIMAIGLSLIPFGITDSFMSQEAFYRARENIGYLWVMISIVVVTFSIIILSMVFLKGVWKVIPFLLGIIGGTIYSLIVWAIAIGSGDHDLANLIYGEATRYTYISNGITKDITINNRGIADLMNWKQWKWYPDVTHMWSMKSANENGFQWIALLGIVPIALVTVAEHIGDHINIGKITNHDFISSNPGIHRTLMGDGIATMVSAALGGPANTSYGENTSVVSITKVASVWVIFGAAIMAIIISFIAPISLFLQALPLPIIGALEIVLYSMIAINGLRILLDVKEKILLPRNIILISIIIAFAIGGGVLTFYEDSIGRTISLNGAGIGIIIAAILNFIFPKKDHDDESRNGKSLIDTIDLNPAGFWNKFILKNKDERINNKKRTKK